MKKIYLIGIGPGDPDYLTVQAINAMKKVDVFFLLEKSKRKGFDFLKIREEILKRYLDDGTYRVVTAEVPERTKGSKPYKEEVKTWRQQKTQVITELIRDNMKGDESGAFLVWGDPSLYDSTLRIADRVSALLPLSVRGGFEDPGWISELGRCLGSRSVRRLGSSTGKLSKSPRNGRKSGRCTL